LLEQQGRELLRQGRGEEALEAFRTLAEKHPAAGLPLLIHGLMRTGRDAEAEKIARREIDSRPSEPAGYLLLAKVHQQRGDSVRQEEVLKSGLDRVEDDVPFSLSLAEFYAGQQKSGQAVAILEKLRRQHPENVSAVFLLGSLLDKSGDKRRAKELYREVLAKNNDHVPALNNLAYLYADNYGNLDEALRLAARAFHLKPGDPGIMDTVGYVLVRLGRQAEALPYLEKSASRLPEQPDVLIHLAQAYSGTGKPGRARETLRKVVAMPYPVQAQQAKEMLKSLREETGKGVSR
jgi:FimV-like protein